MNREFLELYNTELQILKEHGKEFAEAYPEIAERLGGLLTERSDPMITGLLEGAAFLAARVQLKLKHEFPEFTNNLIEQLLPSYLAPIPSVMMVQGVPKFADANLREGLRIPRGAYMDAMFQDTDRAVSCRYRLASELTMWPFEVAAAEYFTSPAPLQALKVPVGSDVQAGLRICLTHRFAETSAMEGLDPAADAKPEYWFSGCPVRQLPFRFLGHEGDCDALYEQVFGRRVGLYFRIVKGEDVTIVPATGVEVRQVGFGEDEALFDNEGRIFEGFDLLREYFVFPRKFYGFRLEGLGAVMQRLEARHVELVMTFSEANNRLLSAVRPSMFSLYAQPAINLFEMSTDRVPVVPGQHEFHVIPDRTRTLDFEPYRVTRVYAHRRGGQERLPVVPLHSPLGDQSGAGLFYTTRRLPRRRSQHELESARRSEYVGTDMFIAIIDPQETSRSESVAELSIRALCTNRHHPESMPQAPQSAEIRLLDNLEIEFACVAGPTKPRESIVSQLRSSSEIASTGTIAWRLINILSLNHLGLSERGAGSNAQALREVLSVFACLPDMATERRIRGVLSVDTSPAVSRLQRRNGTAVARGTEVRITLDEQAFEGWGLFLLGAVLERFFCEYAGFNHFTRTVIVSRERGEVMSWPARTGQRRSL